MNSIIVGRIALNIHKYFEEKTGTKCPKWYFVARVSSMILNDESVRNAFIDSIKDSILVKENDTRYFTFNVDLPKEENIKFKDEFYEYFRKEFLDTVSMGNFASDHLFDVDNSIITEEDEGILQALCGSRSEYKMLKCFVNALSWSSDNFTSSEGMLEAMKYMLVLHFKKDFFMINKNAFKYIGRIIKMQPNVSKEIKEFDFSNLDELYKKTTKELGIDGLEDI